LVACPLSLQSSSAVHHWALDASHAPRYYTPRDRLEALKGDRAGQYSIRVNSQFRVCFRWTAAGAEDVEIVDYH
jgi:plasmid maintenance system killer protein